nr:MAG TPA: hypothetical protein [Caudoviricetes sp.]
MDFVFALKRDAQEFFVIKKERIRSCDCTLKRAGQTSSRVLLF